MSQEMQITNHGQIASMSLPQGWHERPEDNEIDIGGRSLRTFHPIDHEDVQLRFFYRGLPVSEQTGKAFQSILGADPHALSEEEIQSIQEILRERADASVFNIVKCSTDLLNNTPVLVLIGTYSETEKQLYEVFLNAGKDGRLIQEIYLTGPTDLYRQYLKEVRPCLQTIKWTPSPLDLLAEFENTLPEEDQLQ